MHGNTQIFSGIDPLLDELVHQWKKVSEQSIADHGAFHVALAGGGTPRSFYARLANDDVRNSIAWDKVHIYFGDERYVSQDHVDSNYRMAYDVLLSKVNIPVSQIHAMVTPSLTPEQNAQDYVDLIDQKLPRTLMEVLFSIGCFLGWGMTDIRLHCFQVLKFCVKPES